MAEPVLDPDKIDDVALALLSLTLHNGGRAWKGFDWDILDRLHQKGWISNPVGKAKSIMFTEAGLAHAARQRVLQFSVSVKSMRDGEDNSE